MGRKAGNDIMERKMNSLPPGAGGTVCRVEGGGLMRRRLLELGFLPGARVVCRLSRSPGGPSAYEVRGALVALRPKDAATVVVQADAITEGI